MMQSQRERIRLPYFLATLAGLVSVLMALTAPVQAGYVPPADATSPTSRTTAGGRRGGCQESGPIDLVALAPRAHVGQTISTHPTLVWYAPADINQPLEVELYQLGANRRWKRLNRFQLEEKTAGLMSFTLPETEPALTPGNTYRWQVVSTCVVGLPARDLVTSAELEVVSPPADFAIASTEDAVEQARHYADHGYWYDAVALVSTTPTSTDQKAYRKELLLDLANLEESAAGNTETYLSTQLRRIAAEP